MTLYRPVVVFPLSTELRDIWILKLACFLLVFGTAPVMMGKPIPSLV